MRFLAVATAFCVTAAHCLVDDAALLVQTKARSYLEKKKVDCMSGRCTTEPPTTDFNIWNVEPYAVPVPRVVASELPYEFVWRIDQATQKGFLVNETHLKIPTRKSIHAHYWLRQTDPHRSESGVARLNMLVRETEQSSSLDFRTVWTVKHHALQTEGQDTRSADFAIRGAAAMKSTPALEQAAKNAVEQKAMYYAQYYAVGKFPSQLLAAGLDPVAMGASVAQDGLAAKSSVLGRLTAAVRQLDQIHGEFAPSPDDVKSTEVLCLHHVGNHDNVGSEDGYAIVGMLTNTHSFSAQAHLHPLNSLGTNQGTTVYSYDASTDSITVYHGATSSAVMLDADGTHIDGDHVTTYAASFDDDLRGTPDLRQNSEEGNPMALKLLVGIQSIPSAHGWLHEDHCPLHGLLFNETRFAWQAHSRRKSMMALMDPDPAKSKPELARVSMMVAKALPCMTRFVRSYLRQEVITLNTIAFIFHAMMELEGDEAFELMSSHSWNNLSP